MSKYADEIWLMSIEAPGYLPWIIDVQKVGGHDALASELKGVLESHSIDFHGPTSFFRHPLEVYCGIKVEPWFPESAMQLYKTAKKLRGEDGVAGESEEKESLRTGADLEN